jgi:hypothetical protein
MCHGPGGFGGRASGCPTLAKAFALGQDGDLTQKFWKLSEDMVGIKFPNLPKETNMNGWWC